MPPILALREHNVVKVVVSSQGCPRTTSAFAPCAQIAANWQRQWSLAYTAPVMKMIQENQRQLHMASLFPVLQIKPLLDELVTSQAKLVLGSFRSSAGFGALAVMRQQPWEQLAGITASVSSIASPSARDLLTAEADLRTRLQQAHAPPEVVEQAASPIVADPERVKLLGRILLALGHEVATLTPWAFMVLAAWFLLKLANQPGEKSSNDLMVITIMLMMAAWLWPPRS